MVTVNKMKRSFLLPVAGLLLALVALSYSAPYDGKFFKFRQPDNTFVPVRVYGDEFYQRVESMDGYTLIRNDQRWICYAQVSFDGSEFVPTNIIYTGNPDVTFMKLDLKKSLTISTESIRKKVCKRMKQLGFLETSTRAPHKGSIQLVRGSLVGLTILIDFSDENEKIPPTEISDFCNKTGYSNFRNNGSVKDFFADVSNGTVNYTNLVQGYYRAKNAKTYYDVPDSYLGQLRARELIIEALTWLENQGFDFKQLTICPKYSWVQAVNVLYAGVPANGWGEGLDPFCVPPRQAGIVFTSKSGVKVATYQFTFIGDSLRLGYFAHENGHMLGDYPDMYDYGFDGVISGMIGRFCLMSLGCVGDNCANPAPPNAYLRHIIGWEIPTDISNAAEGQVFRHAANSCSSFIFKNKNNASEYFYLESILQKGRYATAPDQGFVIWHADDNGSNEKQQMTPSEHYRVSLEQADGKFHMEKYPPLTTNGDGHDGDLFHGGYKANFNDNTAPNAKWWDESASGLNIVNISDIKDTMSFAIGNSLWVEHTSIPHAPMRFTVTPMKHSVLFSYTVPGASQLELRIYSMTGKCVYANRWIEAGLNTAMHTNMQTWNMVTNNGMFVSCGAYIAVVSQYINETKKLTIFQQRFEIIR